jgi:hypothetical protein
MTTTESVQTGKKPLSWLAMTLIFTNAGLLFLVALALYAFGSFGPALDYLKGDRLMADRSSRSFGEVEQGQRLTIVYELTNASGREITILGAKTNCTCVFAEELPLSVPPRSRRAIKIAVNTDSRDGLIQESISLFTDFPRQPVVELRVLGRVSSSTGQPGKSKTK